MTGGWKVTLSEPTAAGVVELRPISARYGRDWSELRRRNATWLAPWEATSPSGWQGPTSYRAYVKVLRDHARSGTTLPFLIFLDGECVGQLTVSGIMAGSLSSGSLGYWVSEHVAGHGVVPTSVALVIDYCLGELGLHRMEIPIRPENGPSLRVVEKLGLRDEGLRERYLHIQGVWRDHRVFAVTTEELAGGLMARWKRRRQPGESSS